MDKLPIKLLIAKGQAFVKSVVNNNRDKSNQANARILLAKNTQAQIIEELKREDLSKEERKKLINTLYNITPNETAIEGIVRGTSVGKAWACTVGVVAIAYIIFNRKR